MNFREFDNAELLDDLLEAGSEKCGPTADQVCRLVREERARRDKHRGMMLAASILAGLAALVGAQFRAPDAFAVVEKSSQREVAPIAVEAPKKDQHFEIEVVDDAGLLDMLKDKPVALASLPNGERRLLMIVESLPANGAASLR